MSALLSNDGAPPLALLAGGLATRLRPMTTSLPKSLVTVAGQPFIVHQLRLLAAEGVHDIVICCGHLGEQIETFVGDGTQFGCRIRYSYDGPGLLGTGGAICRALHLLGSRFWVMYGDSYLTVAFGPILEAYRRSGVPGLMTVFANHGCWDTSNVEFVNGRIVRYDKSVHTPAMQYIDYGLGLFSADVFHRWPGAAAFDLSHLQARLAEGGELAGYEVTERFYEIGSPSGLAETDAFLTKQMTSDPAGVSLYESNAEHGVKA
jgi:NDP-sugar pyrophosphorylase family protein